MDYLRPGRGNEFIATAHIIRAGSKVTRASGAVALSGDGQRWVLVNVSPLVADQLATDARLLRHQGLPDAAVRAVVLTDAQVDHVTGLLSLRDATCEAAGQINLPQTRLDLQGAVDVAILLCAAPWLSPLQLALSVAGAVTLNFVLAVNHRPDRYLGF